MPNCESINNNNNNNTNTHKPIGGYKEVVIIGNGPSGLCLSYFLSGHWPYWNRNRVSDEYLQMRLEYCENGLSLVEQDLEYLADGLEGRSLNPVALLYDKLKHPDGDLGIDSPTCLTWRYDPLKEVDHICIGKAAGPGGAWNDIDGSQLTISPSRWMELPDMSYADWKRQSKTLANMNAGLVFSAKTPNFSEDNSLLNGSSHMQNAPQQKAAAAAMRRSQSQAHLMLATEEARVSMHDVKEYYQDYARQKNLDKYLLNNATVTSVRRVFCCSKLTGDIAGCSANSNSCNNLSSVGSTSEQAQQQMCWEVSGLIDNRRDRKKASSLTHKGDLMEFRYWCRHLVLANGASDLHNELNVKGESSRFILRSIRELEEKIKDDLPRLLKDPLLIVGSGLSAADAILLAQKYRIRIIHVIRKSVHDPNLIFNKLPKKIYPEYHRVYDQMVRNRYTNIDKNTASSSSSSAASSANSSQESIDNNNEYASWDSNNYVLYDEYQVKQFTSKRTCMLTKSTTTHAGMRIVRPSSSSGSSTPLSSTPSSTNSHMRHLHMQKSHHMSHKRLQLCECEEECDAAAQQPHFVINGHGHGSTTHLNNEELEIKISYACVLIGYSPDLQFLPPTIVNDLPVSATKPLDTKDNPIWIDKFTHETVKCKNLFAMGPLAGDNFVRFGTGGALAIASAVWKEGASRRHSREHRGTKLKPFAAIQDNLLTTG